MKNTIWDDIKDGYQYVETRELKFLTDFLMANAESIFEAAIGSGIIPTLLRKKNWTGRYVGSDYADRFLEMARKNNPDEEFIEIDLLNLLPFQDKNFDISVIHHGLEYVYPYKQALEELKRISKKYVVISMWVDLMPENSIRFNEAGKWNVNYYNREEFMNTTLDIFGYPIMTAVIMNENGKLNYWYIFQA